MEIFMRPWTQTQYRQYDELGNDVTDSGDYKAAKRVVVEHEQMLDELGLTEDSTQAEIDAAKAAHAADLKYEADKAIVAAYEEKVNAEVEPKPSFREAIAYNKALADIAAYEAASAEPEPETESAGPT
jgi:hypothetical protein